MKFYLWRNPCCSGLKVVSSNSITFTFGLIPLGKGTEPPYPPNYGSNSITAALLQGWLWH